MPGTGDGSSAQNAFSWDHSIVPVGTRVYGQTVRYEWRKLHLAGPSPSRNDVMVKPGWAIYARDTGTNGPPDATVCYFVAVFTDTEVGPVARSPHFPGGHTGPESLCP